MNNDLSEAVLGLIIMAVVYIFIAFSLWELDMTQWHWIGRAMWVLMSIGGYMSIEIEYEEEEEGEW